MSPASVERRGNRHALRLLLLLGWLLVPCSLAHEAPAVSGAVELRRVREDYLRLWEELGEQGVLGLERFARLVQHVVDTRAAVGGLDERQRLDLVLDDLVDLFVSARFTAEKEAVMAGESVMGKQVIREGSRDHLGFAPVFRAGDGRFRHFVLNAAAARYAPDTLVDLAARLRGGDLTADSPDSRADIATNRVGREFLRLLQRRGVGELGDGHSVRDWLLERFGEEGEGGL